MVFLEDKPELEKLIEFAERRNINRFELCNIYGSYKELDRVSGNDLVYKRTMQWIYNHS